MIEIGTSHLLFFATAIFLLSIYHVWSYLKLKKRGNLLVVAGTFLIILGIIISQKKTSWGIAIMNTGGGLMMIGYFSLFFITEKDERKKDKKTGLIYSPLFIMIGEVIVGILFVAYGIYDILIVSSYFNGVIAICFGIAIIIYAIISKQKRTGS